MRKASEIVSAATAKMLEHQERYEYHIHHNVTESNAGFMTPDQKKTLDGLNDRVDRIVSQSGNDNTEIVDARNGYTTLGDRLNVNDHDRRDMREKIDNPLVGGTRIIKEDDVYNSWPSLIKTSTGRLICMFNSGASHTIENGSVRVLGRKVCLKYSDDLGITWSDVVDVRYDINSSFMSHSIIGLTNGNIIVSIEEFLSGGNTRNFIMTSLDDGITWNETFDFVNSIDTAIRATGNCNMFFEIGQGKIMSFKHVVYGTDQYGVSAIFSDDNGVTWNSSTVVVTADKSGYDKIPWEIRGVYLGENKIIALGRNDSGNLYQIISSDNGITWSVNTTNISDARSVCVDLVYFSEDKCLVLYYSDRASNTIKRRIVNADLIFLNETQWLSPDIIGYTSSNRAASDFGYITAIRSLSNKREVIGSIYTTREAPVSNGTSKGTAIVSFFDSIPTRSPSVYHFKDVNSTADKFFDLYKGDGTNVIVFRILNGAITMVNGFGVLITAGSDSPEGKITANNGSIYLRRGGGSLTTLYVKESGTGNTGWVAK